MFAGGKLTGRMSILFVSPACWLLPRVGEGNDLVTHYLMLWGIYCTTHLAGDQQI
jgi:hypothetical protein